jgi:hypothetical protein
MGRGAEQIANEVEVQYKYIFGLFVIILEYSELHNRVQKYYLKK